MDKRKNIKYLTIASIAVAAAACFTVFFETFFADESFDPFETVSVSFSTDEEFKPILCWSDRDSDKHYVFLPSFADENSLSVSYGRSYVLTLDGRSFKNDSSLGEIALDRPYSAELSFAGETYRTKLVFLKSEKTPAMFISTTSGTAEYIHMSKSNKEPGEMKLITSGNEISYSGDLREISGRGNATWLLDKKPYRIVLDKPTDLLGMGEAENWVLLANFYDESNIRNRIVYDFAKDIGLKYSPDSRFVDLYLNGQYAGLYQLTEKVEIQKNRVDITNLENETAKLNSTALDKTERYGKPSDAQKGYIIPNNPQDITGGYLFSLQLASRYGDSDSGFITTRSQPVILEGPESASREQMQYLSGLMQEFEDAVYADDGINPNTKKHYSYYIDIDSWARKYIIEEFFVNYDAATVSQFFYKDTDAAGGGKVFAGPVWDYDFSMGNGRIFARNPECFVANAEKNKSDPNVWYYALYKQADFYKKVKQIYTDEFLPCINRLMNTAIDTYIDEFGRSWDMDHIRWKNIVRTDNFVYFDSKEKQIDYLKDFLSKRTAFLNSAWVDGVNYHTVSFSGYTGYNVVYTAVKDGEPIRSTNYSDPPEEGFIGWYYASTDKPYNPDEPVYSDIYLYAKWDDDSGKNRSVADKLLVYASLYLDVIIVTALVFLFAVVVVLWRIKRQRLK